MNTANQPAQTIKSRADIAASLAKLEAENIQLREENERLRLVIDTIPTTPWLSFKASAEGIRGAIDKARQFKL